MAKMQKTNDIEYIEKKILERLRAETREPDSAFAGFSVESFPAKFEEYSFTSAGGCALVQYANTRYGNTRATDAVVQDKALTFNLFCAFRFLNTHSQAYPNLKAAEDLITGLQIDGYTAAMLGEMKFLDEIAGDLWYGATFAVSTLNVENTDRRTISELDKLYPEQTEISQIKNIMAKHA
jgi:hypothetical protein